MNLNKLKPAWQQFKLLSSMQSTNSEEILLILERADVMAINKTHRYLVSAVMFIVLTVCCQGG